MSININNYVSITSGVGAAQSVRTRDLIGRLFTNNNLLPPQGNPLEFTSAALVGAYFGTSSVEYLRAVFYFAWVSKNITRPQKISFSRWVSVAVAPRIYGNIQTQSLAAWQLITNGSFKLTINGTQNVFTGLDFSAVVDLAGVATVLQTAIQTASGVMWTSATVTYNSTRGSFDFVGGSAVAATISVQSGTTGTDIAGANSTNIGWLTGDTLIIAYGSAVETPVVALDRSVNASDNFGSFLFIPALTIDQIITVGVWNTDKNVMFQYCVPVITTDTANYFAQLINYWGLGVTLSNTSGKYPEMVPMMILAATDYYSVNATQNYMFQQFDLPAEVTDDATYQTMIGRRVNFYGRTQSAGQNLDFYQQGVLMGSGQAPTDMNTYANEQWMKAALTARLMTLLLSLPKVSANAQGKSQVLGVMQDVIDTALANGTISVGKILTIDQKNFISEISGDPSAWRQVQNIGYWLDCIIVPETQTSSNITYKAKFTLIYSKDDVIRKVEGRDILI